MSYPLTALLNKVKIKVNKLTLTDSEKDGYLMDNVDLTYCIQGVSKIVGQNL
jgi:hypothetical protein